MRPTKSALLLAAALASFGTLAPERSAAARLALPRPLCDRAATIMATPHVAIVRGFEHNNGAHGFYVCRRGAKRGKWLFDADPDGVRDRIEAAIAGWFVAYRTYTCNKNTDSCSEAAVKVYDGRTGRTRVAEMKRGPDGSALYRAYEPVVTRQGWAAWIVPRKTTPTLLDVYTMAPDGTVSLIATSPNIDPRSIAADARRIYWTDSGQPRSAPLRSAPTDVPPP